MRLHAMLIAAGLGVANPVCALDRMAVEDPKDLMVAAIDAPAGQAHGVLVGRLAAGMAERFKATGPLYMDVDTERRYVQPGCSRLKIRFWQDGIVLPGANTPRRHTVDIGIDYCRDGQPPRARETGP